MLKDNVEFELERIIKHQDSHKSVHLDYIGETFLNLILQLIDVDIACIYILSEDRKEAVIRAFRNIPEEYITNYGNIAYPEGVIWEIINTGNMLNKHDIKKDNSLAPCDRELGICGALGVPIILKDDLVEGVIWLARYDKGKFSKQEVSINLSVADTIGMAISKSRIFDELYDRIMMLAKKLEKDNQILKQSIEDRNQDETQPSTLDEQREILDSLKEILKKFQNSAPPQPANLHQTHIQKSNNSEETLHEKLSTQEYKTMLMIASGMSMKKIASQMYVSISTISTYRARILEKMGLESNAEIIRYAINHNLID